MSFVRSSTDKSNPPSFKDLNEASQAASGSFKETTRTYYQVDGQSGASIYDINLQVSKDSSYTSILTEALPLLQKARQDGLIFSFTLDGDSAGPEVVTQLDAESKEHGYGFKEAYDTDIKHKNKIRINIPVNADKEKIVILCAELEKIAEKHDPISAEQHYIAGNLRKHISLIESNKKSKGSFLNPFQILLKNYDAQRKFDNLEKSSLNKFKKAACYEEKFEQDSQVAVQQNSEFIKQRSVNAFKDKLIAAIHELYNVVLRQQDAQLSNWNHRYECISGSIEALLSKLQTPGISRQQIFEYVDRFKQNIAELQKNGEIGADVRAAVNKVTHAMKQYIVRTELCAFYSDINKFAKNDSLKGRNNFQEVEQASNALHKAILGQVYHDQTPPLENYLTVINHYRTALAKLPTATESEMKKSEAELHAKLYGKKPLPTPVKIALGALVGAIVGFAAGLVLGGVGAIPAAVAGASLGGTLAASSIFTVGAAVTGAKVGAGTALIGAVAGFFSGRNQKNTHKDHIEKVNDALTIGVTIKDTGKEYINFAKKKPK